jgi:hypothetical protein
MIIYTQALYKNRWCDIVKEIGNKIIIEYVNKEIEIKKNDIKEYR